MSTAMRWAIVVAAALAAPVAAGRKPLQEDLLKELPKAKVSLADGIRQLSKGAEAAISGKFELEDGHLSLSVYTVEKGLAVDPEHNVLKEFAGSPESGKWEPKAEVFQDVPHVSRASTQLTLMSLASCSLLDVVAKAEKQSAGATVFSINPVLQDRQGEFVVLAAKDGKVVTLRFDLKGDPVKK